MCVEDYRTKRTSLLTVTLMPTHTTKISQTNLKIIVLETRTTCVTRLSIL